MRNNIIKDISEFVKNKMVCMHQMNSQIFTNYSIFPIIPLCDANWRYNCYPALFAKEFPNVKKKSIIDLSYAFRLALEHILLTDPILEVTNIVTSDVVLWAQLFYDSYLKELYSLFSPKSIFWNYYKTFLHEYMQCMLLELTKIVDKNKDFSSKEYFRISVGKSSLGKTAIASLAILDGSEYKIKPLIASHDFFSFALQIRDDLLDWEEDASNGYYSYLIRYALDMQSIPIEDFSLKRPHAIDQLRNIIYLSGAAEWALNNSRKNLSKAYKSIKNLNVPSWVNFLDQLSKSLSNLSDDLKIINRNFKIKSK